MSNYTESERKEIWKRIERESRYEAFMYALVIGTGLSIILPPTIVMLTTPYGVNTEKSNTEKVYIEETKTIDTSRYLIIRNNDNEITNVYLQINNDSLNPLYKELDENEKTTFISLMEDNYTLKKIK